MMPEERKQKMESYGNAHAVLVEALQRYPREMWQYRASPEGWTIHEIVVHIADSEANSFVRCRRAVAEPGSAVLGYDEMKWARDLQYHAQNPDDSLELFKWLRVNTYRLIRRLPEAAWSQTVEHSESGTMTLERWLDVYERHVPEHLEQMQGVYEAWRKSQKA